MDRQVPGRASRCTEMLQALPDPAHLLHIAQQELTHHSRLPEPSTGNPALVLVGSMRTRRLIVPWMRRSTRQLSGTVQAQRALSTDQRAPLRNFTASRPSQSEDCVCFLSPGHEELSRSHTAGTWRSLLLGSLFWGWLVGTRLRDL